jgi:hypothetical protein
MATSLPCRNNSAASWIASRLTVFVLGFIF